MSEHEQQDAGTAAVAAELGHHTALLEQIAAQGEYAAHQEDSMTFAFATGAAGAFVFNPAMAATDSIEIEGWLSGSAGVPVYVLDGQYTAAQAAALVSATASDYVPVLLTVPASGIARIRRPTYSGYLTVCSLGAPTALALATVRVKACRQ